MKEWYFPIKRVEQGDWNGCGIACTAAVCGVSYERARREFFPRRRIFRDDKSLHVGAVDMLRVIRKLGFTVRHVRTTSFEKGDFPAIVMFSWSVYEGSGIHGIVWNPFTKKFIDPGNDHHRNLKPSHYLKLVRKSDYSSIVITGRRY